MEAFLVPDDLDGDTLTGTMVTTTQDLAERALPKRIGDFISEGQMVMGHNLIVTTLVVIAVIVCGGLRCSLFLVTSCSDEVYRLIVENFLLLVGGKILHLVAFQDGSGR